MKKILFLLIVLVLLPVLSHSHPGKTNRYGGHKCLKGCGGWGLFYDEYHLHDKDGRPIRVGKNKKGKASDTSGLLSTATDTASQEAVVTETTKTAVVTTYRYVTNVYEENIFLSNPLMYILLVLLLLLLVLRMNRKRNES